MSKTDPCKACGFRGPHLCEIDPKRKPTRKEKRLFWRRMKKLCKELSNPEKFNE